MNLPPRRFRNALVIFALATWFAAFVAYILKS